MWFWESLEIGLISGQVWGLLGNCKCVYQWNQILPDLWQSTCCICIRSMLGPGSCGSSLSRSQSRSSPPEQCRTSPTIGPPWASHTFLYAMMSPGFQMHQIVIPACFHMFLFICTGLNWKQADYKHILTGDNSSLASGVFSDPTYKNMQDADVGTTVTFPKLLMLYTQIYQILPENTCQYTSY